MADKPSPSQRWYEQQPTVSKSVVLLEIFPGEFQVILGDTIIALAEKHCRAKELMANLRSLGPEKVLSIFKSKGKRRPFDQHQSTHQAMNYMYILPDPERIYIATEIIIVVGHVVEYFKVCLEEGLTVDLAAVSAMLNTYVLGEFKDVKSFLAQYNATDEVPIDTTQITAITPILTTQLATPETAAKAGDHDLKISHDNKDMKIKLDLP